MGSLRTAAGKREAWSAPARAPRHVGAPLLPVPKFEDATETHEHHGLAKSSIADEVIGRRIDLPCGFDRKRIRIQGCCQVIVSLTEQIESVQWLGQASNSLLGHASMQRC